MVEKNKILAEILDFHRRRHAIRTATASQAQSQDWRIIRRSLVTASNFGNICTHMGRSGDRTKSWANKLKTDLYSSKFSITIKSLLLCSIIIFLDLSIVTSAMVTGSQFEELGRQRAAQKLNKTVRTVGLCISESHPWLGASPDGLIENDSLLEIKTIASAFGQTGKIKFL